MLNVPLRAQEPKFGTHPRLATTSAEWDALQAKPDFEKKREAARMLGDSLLVKPIAVPHGAGDWSFYYACPADASHLHALSDGEHQCPRCKMIYKDERTVASYRTLQHDRVNHAALNLAWAYRYTGDEKYAAEVRRILLKYADDYAGYPVRRDRWGRTGFFAFLGGRRYSQSLDEAVGIIKLAKAYDLIHASTSWTEAERWHVESDFFRETAKTLLAYNQGINNHQTWYNAGILTIASVLGDKDLVLKVLDMKGGFRDQLKRSFGDDGIWYEGTMAYQNYALQAMIEIVDAGRRLGLPLHEEPRFRTLLESPLTCAYPNGQFPALNDSDPSGLANFNHAWAWAWQTYRDPKFARVLAGANLIRLKELLGPDAVLEPYLPGKSTVLGDIGLGILRRGAGLKASCVMVDFGPHGGGHGHYDKLSIVLFANGREWLLDPGRLSYSHKEYATWVKQTAAHNTVAVGGRSQSATTGKLVWFSEQPEFVGCGVASDSAYRGAKLRRQLLLFDTMLIDRFEVESAEPTQIDLFAHAVSKQVVPAEPRGPGAKGEPGSRDGYQHLLNARSWQTEGPSGWRFEADKSQVLYVHFAGLANEEIIACEGIGYQVAQKIPCLIRRVQGKTAAFVTVYDLSASADAVQRVEVEGRVVTVHGKAGRTVVRLEDAGAKVAFGE